MYKLTAYGKRYLALLYKKYKDNTEFKTFEDFCSYMGTTDFCDWKIIKLDIEQNGLFKDNIIIEYNKSKLRGDRLNLFDENLSYDKRVKLLKEFSANLLLISELYEENKYYINILKAECSNDELSKIHAYMSNGIYNISKVYDLIDKLRLSDEK